VQARETRRETRTSLCPRGSERDIQRPLLPAHVLVGLCEEVRLSPALFEELHDELPPAALLVGALYGAHERNGPLVDEGLEVDIVDGGQGQVEQVARERGYGGEVAVEEDGVQDCCGEGRRVSGHMLADSDGGRESGGAALPFTTSLTQARSAKMSRWYSGRRRWSMMASGRALERGRPVGSYVCMNEEGPRRARAATETRRVPSGRPAQGRTTCLAAAGQKGRRMQEPRCGPGCSGGQAVVTAAGGDVSERGRRGCELRVASCRQRS